MKQDSTQVDRGRAQAAANVNKRPIIVVIVAAIVTVALAGINVYKHDFADVRTGNVRDSAIVNGDPTGPVIGHVDRYEERAREKTREEKARQRDADAAEAENDVLRGIGKHEKQVQNRLYDSAAEGFRRDYAMAAAIGYSDPGRKFFDGMAAAANGLGMVENALSENALGEDKVRLRRQAQGHWHDALVFAGRAPSQMTQAIVHLNRGNSLVAIDPEAARLDLADGIEALRDDLVFRTDIGHPDKQKQVTALRSALYNGLGQVEDVLSTNSRTQPERLTHGQSAEKYFRLACKLGDAVGDVPGRSGRLQNLAVVQAHAGKWKEAWETGRAASVLNRGEDGDPYKLGTNLHLMGECSMMLADWNEARGSLADALTTFGNLPNYSGLVMAMQSMAKVHIHEGEYEQAALLLLKARVLRTMYNCPQAAEESSEYRSLKGQVESRMGAKGMKAAQAVAARTSLKSILSKYARSLRPA
jgi:tetratricopeptide (TPR) repeat protein